MTTIITTIPRTKFRDWETCERVLRSCTGEDMYWLINTANLPKKEILGGICWMVFAGEVRGYFDIVDTDLSENYRDRHGIGKTRNTICIVMANWHPQPGPELRGFQGWRYSQLRP